MSTDLVGRLRASLSYDTPARYPEMVTEAADEIERLQREIEYTYRVINFGFTYGNFDFSTLKETAAKFVVNADVAAAKAE